MNLLPRPSHNLLAMRTPTTGRRTRRLIAPAALLLAFGLCGCAGGSAGGGAVQQPGSSGAQRLGQRAVPGGVITVTASDAVIAGSPAVFHVALSGFASLPTMVRARIGSRYDEDAAMIPATPAGDGYDLTLQVPDTASRVWVRLEFADGSASESGASDFSL